MNEIVAMLVRPQDFLRLESIKNKIFIQVSSLYAEVAKSDEPIPYKKISELEFKPIHRGQHWAKPFGCGWFRVHGEIPEIAKGKKIVALLSIGGEGLVYRNGEAIGTITNVLSIMDLVQATHGKRMIEITDNALPGENVDLLIDGGFNGTNGTFIYGGMLGELSLNVFNEWAYKYYYDFLTLSLTVYSGKENVRLTKERKKYALSLMKKSFTAFCRDDFAKAVEIIGEFYKKERDYEDVEFTAIGHAHLDLAWLWPIRETKRKGARTLTNACHYIDKYPNYVFGMSQAALADWMEKDYPDIWEKVKKNVAEKRIEIQGNMWVECDCNLPCGESLIRQFYYGDDYFINKFGADSKVVWLPDVFGFTAAMPKIIKGVGKKYFMTIKLSWNKYNKFPYNTFNWVGDDGSKIIAHIAPEGNYVSTGSPVAIVNAANKYQNKEAGRALIIYGVGDGGAGPGDGHIEVLNRVEKIYELNKVTKNSSESFFDAVDSSVIPDYKGELYLEKHQGTFTSQAKIKLFNRLMEKELHNLEFLLAAADKDNTILHDYWKETLLYQFHDILPGSSINRVNREALERYGKMYADLLEIRSVILSKLGKEKALYALNLDCFEREETIEYNEKFYKAVCSAFGAAELEEFTDESLVYNPDEMTVENSYYKLKLGKNGEIYKMYDKLKDIVLNNGNLNELVVYIDPRTYYNAWDIKKSYLNTIPKHPRMVSRSVINNKSVIVVNQSFVYNKSMIRQKIVLDGKMVRFENIVTWNEKYKMLRVNFSPSIYGENVACDIQFGEIERSTKNETSVEQAQYEICAHKYVATQDEDGIFGVFSDCKYGYYIKNGVISMNLLRSPKYPDKECDIGTHSFGFAIMVADDKKELVRYAYNYDNPVIITESKPILPSLFEIDNKNLIIETIKPYYGGKGIAVRIYERYGNEEKAIIRPLGKYKYIYESDLLENNLKRIDGADVRFTPHAIKTFIMTEAEVEINK